MVIKVSKAGVIWWPYDDHVVIVKMMTMVVLVVILWSSYDDHGLDSKMMTTSGVMVIILVECSPERSPHPFWSSLFSLFVPFFGGIFKCTGPAMPTNTWPIKMIPPTVSGSDGQKTNLCIVWQFPPGLSWWRVFAYHHHAALILGMFWHKTLRICHDMSILTLAVYVQNLLVVSDKPEQLIWVNKKWSLVHRPPENPAVINRAHGLV